MNKMEIKKITISPIMLVILVTVIAGVISCKSIKGVVNSMKIAVLNGSPHVGNTSALVKAFMEGAQAAGHEVEEIQVGKMKIAGCLGCGYCHTKGEGKCVQKPTWSSTPPRSITST